MAKDKKQPSIKDVFHEIELFNAENCTKKTNRVRFYKEKLKNLGAIKKTYFIPFKHRLIVADRRKNEKKRIKSERHDLGLSVRKHKKK